MAKYLMRKEPKIGLVQIAKEENGHYSYWNNILGEWRENSPTAFGIFTGFEDGLYEPVSEEDAMKIVSQHKKDK